MRVRRVAYAVGLHLSWIVGCDAFTPRSGHVDPDPALMGPIALGERMRTVSSTSSKEESRRVGVVGEEPPEMCFGTDQPAIVRVQPDDSGARRSVWSCQDGCAPGFEFVTTATQGTLRRRAGEVWYFEPRCEPICPAGAHRISWLIDRSSIAASTCAAGPASPAEVAARGREEERRVEAAVGQWRRDRDGIIALLVSSEQRPVPWDDATLRDWITAKERLDTMQRGLPGWFVRVPEIAIVSQNYRSVDEPIAKAAAESFLERVEKALAAEPPTARLSALRRRLEDLERPARDASKRAAESRAQAAARAREEERAAMAAKERDVCLSGCQRDYQACAGRCLGLTKAVCDMCEVTRSTCVPTCATGR